MMTSEHELQQEAPSTVDMYRLFSAVWKSKKKIALITFFVTLAVIGMSFLITETFLSTATILPDTDRAKSSSLGSLADLASSAGISTGDASTLLVKLFPTIIKSDAVLRNVIYKKYKTRAFSDSVNLIQYWNIQEKTPERCYDAALKSLQDNLNVASDLKLLYVTISLETDDPQLSSDIINTVIAELDKYIRTKRKSNASEQRKWIEGRLADVQRDLTTAENSLENFRDKNRMITGSPQLMLEQDRLLRNVQLNTTLFLELKKQYEMARIEEVKNIPLVNVMDYARPAAKKNKPKKGMIAITALFLSFFGSVGYVALKEQYGERLRFYKSEFVQKVLRD